MIWSVDWTFVRLTELYKEQPELVRSAMQRMIESDPELAWSLVVSAYLDEEINLGKAAEMLGLHELELRDRFVSLGIPLRTGPADKAEAQAEAQALDSWFAEKDADSPS